MPLEDVAPLDGPVGNIADAGAAQVLYGTPGGIAASANQFWHQDVSGIEDTAETGDQFGSSLASGAPTAAAQ